jgi:hypothetical protein
MRTHQVPDITSHLKPVSRQTNFQYLNCFFVKCSHIIRRQKNINDCLVSQRRLTSSVIETEICCQTSHLFADVVRETMPLKFVRHKKHDNSTQTHFFLSYSFFLFLVDTSSITTTSRNRIKTRRRTSSVARRKRANN